MSCSLPGSSNPNFKHGHGTKIGGATKTYRIWQAMLNRVRNPKSLHFTNYGGRGITVCDQWFTFTNFLADLGECPADLMLERRDSDGNYEPANCYWATRHQQNQNRRSNKLDADIVARLRKRYQDGARISDLSREFGIHYATMSKAVRGKTW